VEDCLPKRLVGINSSSMVEYVQYCADHLLERLGYPSIWNTSNPYDFMTAISIDSKTNFFEKRIAEYQMACVGTNSNDTQFGTDEVF
jgi:ribonucleoside-diphosphate reductase beta chain